MRPRGDALLRRTLVVFFKHGLQLLRYPCRGGGAGGDTDAEKKDIIIRSDAAKNSIAGIVIQFSVLGFGGGY